MSKKGYDFNAERALAGEPLTTDDGFEVRNFQKLPKDRTLKKYLWSAEVKSAGLNAIFQTQTYFEGGEFMAKGESSSWNLRMVSEFPPEGLPAAINLPAMTPLPNNVALMGIQEVKPESLPFDAKGIPAFPRMALKGAGDALTMEEAKPRADKGIAVHGRFGDDGEFHLVAPQLNEGRELTGYQFRMPDQAEQLAYDNLVESGGIVAEVKPPPSPLPAWYNGMSEETVPATDPDMMSIRVSDLEDLLTATHNLAVRLDGYERDIKFKDSARAAYHDARLGLEDVLHAMAETFNIEIGNPEPKEQF